MRPLPWAMSPPNTPRPARRSACWCAARPCRPRPAPFPSSPNATPSKETTRMTVRYTKDHEWVRLDGEVATIGISDYAQSQRSEEHTSELQSLMRISYAVFCLKKKTTPLDALTPHNTTLSKQDNAHI